MTGSPTNALLDLETPLNDSAILGLSSINETGRVALTQRYPTARKVWRGTYRSQKPYGTPLLFEEVRTKICERLAQQGWLVNKIVEEAGFSGSVSEASQGFDWARGIHWVSEEKPPHLAGAKWGGRHVFKSLGFRTT